jgi:hypothetical protein
MEGAMSLLALAGAIVMLRRCNQWVWPLVSAAVGYALVYTIIESGPRYRYPVEGIMLVLCSALIARPGGGKTGGVAELIFIQSKIRTTSEQKHELSIR